MQDFVVALELPQPAVRYMNWFQLRDLLFLSAMKWNLNKLQHEFAKWLEQSLQTIKD